MYLLLVAATPFEIAPTLAWLQMHFTQKTAGIFEKENLVVRPLITGVGMTATAFHLGQVFAQRRPDWAVNAGIAGALDRVLKIGDVVQINTECFGDLGIEEADGRFVDLVELGFAPAAELQNPNPNVPGISNAKGLTVNKVHGTAVAIQKIREKYPEAQVESMEGAAFFYACLTAGIPFLEMRGISNYVEPRNRAAWDLPLAIGNLNAVLQSVLDSLEGG